jgi:hypothetical protein
MSDRNCPYKKYLRHRDFEIRTLQNVIQLTRDNFMTKGSIPSKEIIELKMIAEKRLRKLEKIDPTNEKQIHREASKIFHILR